MHIESLQLAARTDIEQVEEETRLFSSPPDGLQAAIAWEDAEGTASVIFVWDDAGASTRWNQEAMWPKLKSGELSLGSEPPQSVEPIHAFVRGG